MVAEAASKATALYSEEATASPGREDQQRSTLQLGRSASAAAHVSGDGPPRCMPSQPTPGATICLAYVLRLLSCCWIWLLMWQGCGRLVGSACAGQAQKCAPHPRHRVSGQCARPGAFRIDQKRVLHVCVDFGSRGWREVCLSKSTSHPMSYIVLVFFWQIIDKFSELPFQIVVNFTRTRMQSVAKTWMHHGGQTHGGPAVPLIQQRTGKRRVPVFAWPADLSVRLLVLSPGPCLLVCQNVCKYRHVQFSVWRVLHGRTLH